MTADDGLRDTIAVALLNHRYGPMQSDAKANTKALSEADAVVAAVRTWLDLARVDEIHRHADWLRERHGDVTA